VSRRPEVSSSERFRLFPGTFLEFFPDPAAGGPGHRAESPSATGPRAIPAGRVLRIDLRDAVPKGLSVELARRGLGGPFAVVTACNPGGLGAGPRPGGREEGEAERTARLETELRALGCPSPLRVDGCSPDFRHRERGFAVPLPESRALELAARHDQAAIFWWAGAAFWLVGALDPALARVRLPSAIFRSMSVRP
jgi:hypothetical protein